MSNILAIVVILLIITLAVSGSIKHFKGEGACCGGGRSVVKEPDKKLNNPVIGKRTFIVEGMHCENCRNRVKRAINSIEGASCKVNLKKGRVDIEIDREIDDDVFINAIENLDFHVVSK